MQRLLIATLCLAAAACTKAPGTCTDGVRSGQEADVNCGGPDCGRCAEGRACLTHDDCETGLCRLRVCATPPKPVPFDAGEEVECRRSADCGSGACLDGQCIATCAPPLATCGPFCVDPRWDPLNCGACGRSCGATERCENGGCLERCPAGMLLCPGEPQPRCVDVRVDVTHCGNCTDACQPGERCVAGACQPRPCEPFQTRCNGECVITSSDVFHCGGCGNACDAGMLCAAGNCQLGCTAPLVSCDAGMACVDVRFDARNCGACGAICPPVPNAAPLCLGMSCSRTRCNPGFEDCNAMLPDGCEAQLAIDDKNCGVCGRMCVGGPCVNGSCP